MPHNSGMMGVILVLLLAPQFAASSSSSLPREGYLELGPAEHNFAAFSARCVAPRVPCVWRRWAQRARREARHVADEGEGGGDPEEEEKEEEGEEDDPLSWRGVRALCGHMAVGLGRFRAGSRGWAALDDVPQAEEPANLGAFMDRLDATRTARAAAADAVAAAAAAAAADAASGDGEAAAAAAAEKERSYHPPHFWDFVFDESFSGGGGCPKALASYIVPFVAANDLLHRARIKGSEDEAAAGGGGGGGATGGGGGAPVPYDDHPSLFVQPRGSRCGLHVDSGATHFMQVLHAGRKRWTLGLANGTTVSTLETSTGDLVFIPAEMPHAVASLEDCVASSINWLDASNWLGRGGRGGRGRELLLRNEMWLQQADREAKTAHLDALARADDEAAVAGRQRKPGNLGYWEWDAGRAGERFGGQREEL
jgi:hypothetical protein